MSIDAAILKIPDKYRFYSVDASIPNRFIVTLALSGEDRDLWHAQGETLDMAGRDIRPNLYACGVADTLAGAVTAAIDDIGATK